MNEWHITAFGLGAGGLLIDTFALFIMSKAPRLDGKATDYDIISIICKVLMYLPWVAVINIVVKYFSV